MKTGKESDFQEQKKGKVWLVGAGPYDAGLMTIKGKAVLEQAEVVLYDHLVSQGILEMIPREAKRINVGKISNEHRAPQSEINQILVAEALSGKRVVRLKGGDPFIFSRGGEELEEIIKYKIPFEVVPGITSAIAVPAYNGIPVTHRDYCSSVHIITGHAKNLERGDIDFPSLVKCGGTLVFLLGADSMSIICQELMNAGMDPAIPAAVLENGTSAHQRRVISDLRNLPEEAAKAEIRSPSVIVVGKVCSLAELFHWAEDRPLGRLKIMVAEPKDKSSGLAAALLEYGAEVAEDTGWYDDSFDYIAFTSVSMVKGFSNKVSDLDYTRVKAVCIEDQIATEARKYGMSVFIAEKASIDGMVGCFLALAGKS